MRAKSAPLTAGSRVARPIGSPVPGAAFFVLDGGCGRCRPGWSVSCMWPGRGGGRVLAPGRVDRVAVCGVPVRGRGAGTRMYRTGDLVCWGR